MIYVVIKASDETIATKAFREYEDAYKHWKILGEYACNFDAYYIRSLELV